MVRLAISPKSHGDLLDRLLDTNLTDGEVRKVMRSHRVLRPIHGIYNPVQDVKAAADAKVRSAGFEPEQFEWIGNPEPPSFEEENEEVVVGLYDTLDSFAQTTVFFWAWMSKGHKRNWRLPAFKTDRKRLRDFRDPKHKKWRPRTRRWVKIDLSANRGMSPKWTRANVDPSRITGLEVMAAMAQHPKAMAARDGLNKPALNLTALDFNWEQNGRPWQSVPYVSFRRRDGMVVLYTAHSDAGEDDYLSCPVLLLE